MVEPSLFGLRKCVFCPSSCGVNCLTSSPYSTLLNKYQCLGTPNGKFWVKTFITNSFFNSVERAGEFDWAAWWYLQMLHARNLEVQRASLFCGDLMRLLKNCQFAKAI